MLIEPRDVPTLSLEECARAAQAVDRLKEYWVLRSEDAPFYTLGAPSYLDGRDATLYQERARVSNPLLWTSLEWLYRRLRERLEEVLEAPAVFGDGLGLPGFHIFLSHPAFCLPVASVHCDLQYEFHLDRFAPTPVDVSNPLSFTLAIELPASGAGLNLWPLHRNDVCGVDAEEAALRILAHTQTYHPYRCGVMVMHSGHQVHQIAPAESMAAHDRRVTLQGHGVRCGETWMLYW